MARSVIVTGAGRGIGRAVALRFAEDGWHVTAVDVDGSAVADTADRAGATVVAAALDISDRGAADAIVETAVGHAGGVDVLVNNAAVSLGESFLRTRPETWQRTIEVNLSGTFWCSQAVARWMVEHRRPGRIINVASTNGYAAQRDGASYVTSKGGVLALTRAMAVDLAEHGVLVNAVAPGPIRTESNAAAFDADPLRRGILKGVPLSRPGTAEEVAGVIAFLAGGDATFVNGAALVVDGGYLAYARFD